MSFGIGEGLGRQEPVAEAGEPVFGQDGDGGGQGVEGEVGFTGFIELRKRALWAMSLRRWAWVRGSQPMKSSRSFRQRALEQQSSKATHRPSRGDEDLAERSPRGGAEEVLSLKELVENAGSRAGSVTQFLPLTSPATQEDRILVILHPQRWDA
ncbi:MAG: hypothetical protein WC429_16985 [Verrucomicrobiia bacterium]